MILLKSKKIILVTLGLLIIFGGLLFFVKYAQSQHTPNENKAKSVTNSKGVCAPDMSSCQGNPKLCMELNKNVVCN